MSAEDAFTFAPLGDHDTSTNLGDNEKIHTASFKAPRTMNVCAESMLNSLNAQRKNVIICKECTSSFSLTNEKCNGCGWVTACESGLSSTQEISVSDSDNVALSFGGVISGNKAKMTKQLAPTGFRVGFADPASQCFNPSDLSSTALDRESLSLNLKTGGSNANNAVTQVNNGATSQFQAGDWVEYKETKMKVVQRANPFDTDSEEQFWMIKAEKAKNPVRVKAKNMKKVDDL